MTRRAAVGVPRVNSVLLIGAALTLLTLASARPATAQVRSAYATNSDAAYERSGPTRPVLQTLAVRYDPALGQIDATVGLTAPLAAPEDPAAEDLATWRIEVELGDWLHHGNCSGWSGTAPRLRASLGDDLPGIYDDLFDEVDSSAPIPVPVTKTFAADRRSILLTVAHPRLRALNLICAAAGVSDTRVEYECSCIFGAAFAGYTGLDGAVERETASALVAQVDGLASEWDTLALLADVACARRPVAPGLACELSIRLYGFPGDPQLTLLGTVRVEPTRRAAFKWRMRGALSWRRCPAGHGVPPALRGRRCRVALRWRARTGEIPGMAGGPNLSQLLPRRRGLRAVRGV